VGLSQVIAGFLSAMVLISIITYFGYTLFVSSDRYVLEAKNLERELLVSSNTKVKILNLTVTSPNNVLLEVGNDGNTKVIFDEKFDVIVDYINSNGERRILKLNYESPSNGWTVLNITRDYIDPGILNPHEVAFLSLNLSEDIGSGTLTVIICPEYGYPSQIAIKVS